MFHHIYGRRFGVSNNFNRPNNAELAGNGMHQNLPRPDYSKPIMHKIWEAIALSPSNQLIIGTNKVSAQEATFWSFEDCARPLTEANCCFNLRCKSWVSKIAYLGNYVLLIAFKCGAVQLWSTRPRLCTDEIPYNLFMDGEAPIGHFPILSLDRFKTNTAKAASGDIFGKLVLWNAAGINFVDTYLAHTDSLSGLDTSHVNVNIIATCGYDKRAFLWDFRNKKPVIALFEDHKVRFNDIAWHASPGHKENLLTIADETGVVHTLDARKPCSFVQSTQLLDCPITKILPRNDKMGIIGDTTNVLVVNSSNHEVLYQNDDALGYQRDGVWHTDAELYTVGHDGKLNAH